FRDQNGKRRADRAADDADGSLRKHERVERGVVAGPALERPRRAGSPEVANDVPVRVENADRRHVDGGETLLPPRFAQQRGGPEHRRRRRVLVVENRGHGRGETKARAPQHRDSGAAITYAALSRLPEMSHLWPLCNDRKAAGQRANVMGYRLPRALVPAASRICASAAAGETAPAGTRADDALAARPGLDACRIFNPRVASNPGPA